MLIRVLFKGQPVVCILKWRLRPGRLGSQRKEASVGDKYQVAMLPSVSMEVTSMLSSMRSRLCNESILTFSSSRQRCCFHWRVGLLCSCLPMEFLVR
jgi:hypothetical protein